MDDVSFETRKEKVLEGIERAKSKGVTAIKVELEAKLNRYSSDYSDCDCCSSDRDCRECDEGRLSCEEAPHDSDYDCGGYDCNGTDYECDRCDGDYENYEEGSSEWTDERCLRHMLTAVGLPSTVRVNRGNHGKAYTYNAEYSDWLQYIEFYNDGSVDSEATFTVRLDNPENVFKALEMIDAFKSLASAIGNGINVEGAGMHVAWLFSDDYSYPVEHSTLVSRVGGDDALRNFARSMNQLMPALFFLAAPANGKNWTRRIGYRSPTVGVSSRGGKYSAVFINGGAMEYRVFDTCYDNTQQFLDNVVVMANTLKYLDPTKSLEMKYPLTMFGNEADNTLDRLYYQENTLDMLYEYVGLIKPSYYTMKQLRKQRNFTMNKRKVKSLTDKARERAELAYQEYRERQDMLRQFRVEEYRANQLRRLIEASDIGLLRSSSLEELRMRVEDRTQQYLRAVESEMTSQETFVANVVNQELRVLNPEYAASV